MEYKKYMARAASRGRVEGKYYYIFFFFFFFLYFPHFSSPHRGSEHTFYDILRRALQKCWAQVYMVVGGGKRKCGILWDSRAYIIYFYDTAFTSIFYHNLFLSWDGYEEGKWLENIEMILLCGLGGWAWFDGYAGFYWLCWRKYFSYGFLWI